MWKYYALLVAFRLLGRLPRRVIYAVARLAADGAYLLRPRIRRHVQANMRHVLGPGASPGQVARAAREAVRNAARYYADMIRMPHMDVGEFYQRDLTLEGLHHLRKAMDEGKGTVLVSAHFGNPEIAVQGLAAVGIPVLALTEPLEPPQLFALTQRLRSAHGHTHLPAGFGGVKEALRRLRSGGVVAILIDRDIQQSGLPMPFCGSEARMPTGAVELALRTGAELIPAIVYRERGFRYHAYMGPPFRLVRTGDQERDVQVNSANLLFLFERHLRSDPGQWAVLEPVWPENSSEAASPRPGTVE